MHFWSHRRVLSCVVVGTSCAVATPVFAYEAPVITEMEGVGTLGASGGLRASANFVEDAAGTDGDDWSQDFIVDEAQLRTMFSSDKGVSAVLNVTSTDSISDVFDPSCPSPSPGIPPGSGCGDSSDRVEVVDAYASLELSDAFNIIGGRVLTPTDRNNLANTFFQNLWDSASFASTYVHQIDGRDDGVLVHGAVGSGHFTYAVGAFEGVQNVDDNFAYSGRVQYNFGDTEESYYRASTYYGTKNLTAIGLAFQSQKDGAVPIVGTESGDLFAWNIDVLFERSFSSGAVFTAEGAYYDYDTDDVFTDSVLQSTTYYVTLAYLFAGEIGPGRLQPVARIQNVDGDDVPGLAGIEVDVWEAGLNYVIQGHDAVVKLTFGNVDPDVVDDVSFIQVGFQVQIAPENLRGY